MAQATWPRETASLWNWLRVLLWAAIVAQLCGAALEGYELSLATPIEQQPDLTLILYGLLALLLGIVGFIVFLLCVVFTLRLTYRLMKNLHAIDTPGMKMSPVWAAAWYFVPFANLYLPRKAVGQIWDQTFALTDDVAPDDIVVTLWWVLWIVSNIASTVSWRMLVDAGGMDEFGPTDPDQYRMSLYVGIFSGLTGAASSWFMLRVFGPLSRAQDAIMPSRTPAAA